jgi:hypothetical protein
LLWIKLNSLLPLELWILHNRSKSLVRNHPELIALLLILVLLELLLIQLLDMTLPLSNDHILNNIILCVKNNISKLSKVLNDILVLEVSLNNNRASLVVLEVGVLNKLFDQWIQDSVELLALGQPTPAGQSQSWVCVFQEVYHVVKGKIFLTRDLRFERLVAWVVGTRELPEDRELLDGAVLHLAGLFVL